MTERSVVTLTESGPTLDVPQAGDTYKMPRATKVDTADANTVAILTLANTAGSNKIFRVDATPEAAVTGSPGDLALSSEGKTYRKATGTDTNTGWVDITILVGATEATNTYIGVGAAAGAGDYNTLMGVGVGVNMTGDYNTAVGHNAMGSGTGAAASWGNICVGRNSGYALSSGDSNVLVGSDSGDNLTTGWDNVAIGKQAMGICGVAAAQNVFVGSDAGRDCSTSANACVGYNSALNTTGGFNSMLGFETGINAGSIQYNTYLGYKAGRSSNGSYNIFIGYNVGSTQNVSNTLMIGGGDTATPLIHSLVTEKNVGFNCGDDYGSGQGCIGLKDAVAAPTGNMTGGLIIYSEGGVLKVRQSNGTVVTVTSAAAALDGVTDSDITALGVAALDSWTNGTENTAVGYQSFEDVTTGDGNTGLGWRAGGDLSGNNCTVIGAFAMSTQSGGYNSVAVGWEAGKGSGANGAVFLGYQAGLVNTGDGCIMIGKNAGDTIGNVSNQLFIDNTNSTAPLIHGNMANDNIGFNCGEDYGSGVGVVGIKDAGTVPSGNMTGGGILYSESGALKWRGSSGTITELAPA